MVWGCEVGNKARFSKAPTLPRPRGAGPASRAPLFAVLLLACFVVPLSPQENPDQRTIGFGPSWRVFYIEGLVVDEASGAPLRGVRLQLFSPQSGGFLSAVDSDRDGRFVFLNLRGGSYQILANHPDYEDKTFPIELFAAEANVRLAMPPRSSPPPPSASRVGVWALKIPSKAEKEFERAVERLKKRETRRAIQHLQATVAIYPEYASAYTLLGTAHLMMQEPDEAKEAYQRALAIDEHLPEACFGLGSLFRLENRFEQAEELLLRARTDRPNDWRVHLELGQVYLQVDNLELAEASLQQALTLHQDYPRLHLFLINSLALQEKYTETLTAMETFLRLFPKDEFAEQVRQKHDLLKAEMQAGAVKQP